MTSKFANQQAVLARSDKFFPENQIGTNHRYYGQNNAASRDQNFVFIERHLV